MLIRRAMYMVNEKRKINRRAAAKLLRSYQIRYLAAPYDTTEEARGRIFGAETALEAAGVFTKKEIRTIEAI